MSQIQFLALFGVASLMVLGTMLVMGLVFWLAYKFDRTYEDLGFWGNTRLEIAEMIAGKFRR